jgi:Salmonella virulence plasmid 65kDa B protein
MRLFRAGLVFAAFILGNCSDPATSQTPPKSTLTPGTIEGSFDVTLSGSATYAIPLKIPPGTAGTQPKLSLVYNSQAGSSSMGVGWSVSGLSKIARGPKNRLTDGVVHGVDFKKTDAFYLDGQRLIPTGKPGVWKGKTTSEYVKEIDDQTHIQALSAGSDDPSGFVVETKAGLTLQFWSGRQRPEQIVRQRSDSGVVVQSDFRLGRQLHRF